MPTVIQLKIRIPMKHDESMSGCGNCIVCITHVEAPSEANPSRSRSTRILDVDDELLTMRAEKLLSLGLSALLSPSLTLFLIGEY